LRGYLSGNVDIAPTIAELAGASAPDFVEGRSLTPLFFNQPSDPKTWRQAFFIEYYPEESDEVGWQPTPLHVLLGETISQAFRLPFSLNLSALLSPAGFSLQGALKPAMASDEGPIYGAVRTARYKYIEYVKGYRELYDLNKDPYELNNLAESADQALLDQLSTLAHRLYACSGASCRTIEQEPTP
jgi:N-acetylglucosamine-6-sulfatase